MYYSPSTRNQGDSGGRWRMVDRFDSSYWSGKDVKVYANDVHIEEALQVTYQLLEQVRPYYHYSSYEPDRLHHGTRLVTGELTINFKRAGYLFALLSYLRLGEEEGLPPRLSRDEIRNGEFESVRPPTPYVNQPWGPTELERLKDASATEVRRILDQRRQLTEDNNRWIQGDDPSERYAPGIFTTSGVFETTPRGFSLNIIFGSDMRTGQTMRFHNEDYYTLGPAATYDGEKVAAGTGFKVVGVELMGNSVMVDDSGRPVTETYAFQARSVQILTHRLLAKE